MSNIVSNTEQLGTLAGELLQQGLKDAGYKKANILALTGVASSNVVIDAMAALRKQLASTPEYKIVSVQDTQWDQTNAQQLASQVFAQWAPKGGIQAVYGSNGANVAGAIEAGQKIGLTFDGKGGIVAVSGACFPVDYGNIDGGLEYGAVSESPLDEARPAVRSASTGSTAKLSRPTSRSTSTRSPRRTWPRRATHAASRSRSHA